MYKTKILPNGIRLLTSPMRGTKTATILVMVGTGSRYENRQISGLSHFLEHMFFKGTKNRPDALSISSELDAIGAEFNAFTSKEYTGYWVKSDSKKIDTSLDLLSDMLFNSKFDSAEIDRERGVIIEECNMYEDNPMMHVEDVFERVLYGNTPAGWDTIGHKDSIMKVKRDDFVEYFSSQYIPENITICLVGNLGDIKKAERKVGKFFGTKKLDNGNFIEKEKVIENQKKPQILAEYKKTDQAHFSLGVRSYGYNAKEKSILKLMSIILGGSMSSRLFINLRERHGLAYYVRTNSEVYSDTGYLTTGAGVPVDKIDKAIKIILSEYRKLKTKLVDKKELQRAKDLLNGRLAIQMEGSDNVANWYARQTAMEKTVARTAGKRLANKDILTPEKYLKEINSIKASDIRNVAKKIFVNKGLNMAVIGPYKRRDKFSKLLKV